MAVANRSVFLQTMMLVANQYVNRETPMSSYNNYFLDIGIEMQNDTRCYGSYGCFQLSPPWTSEHRPVSLFPQELAKIEPTYPFYNNQHPDKPVLIDLNEYDVIDSSGIDPYLPLYVISHGFMDNGNKEWIKEMKNKLLARENCSVIVVNWEGGSSPPYTQAVANIRLVGSITAHLLSELGKRVGHLNHVHCIGHSLGAHCCGYIGYTLKKIFNLELGRISGLDPAEPHFAKNKPPVRLDRSAAKFVDVIHTDASAFIRGGFGIIERIGHIDYYPNGGTDQPGCTQSVVEYISLEKSFFSGLLFTQLKDNVHADVSGVKKFLGCNHLRGYEYFTESIDKTDCSFLSISCSSYEDFKNGHCFKCGANGRHCLPMGFHSKATYDKFIRKHIIRSKDNLVQYLLTGDSKPYCKAHFKVKVKISDTNESFIHGGEIGQLWLVMHATTDGTGPRSSKVPLNDRRYHAPAETYQYVIAADGIKNLKAVEIEWQYNSMLINPLTWRILTTPRLYVSMVKVDALEINQSITVCSKDNKPLISGISQLMLPSYCV